MERERLACIHCDLLITLGDLQRGERAYCPRCGHLLSAWSRDGLTRSLAFATAAAVFLLTANVFPFLALKASGLENVMTLPMAAVELYRDGYTPIALLVFGVIVVVPGLMLAAVFALVVPIRGRWRAPWLVPAGRALFWLSPWSMVEVFVIGVVVSLVKIGHLATVVLGLSFWSYVAFSVCFTAAMSNLDRLEVWTNIEECSG